MNYLLIKQPWIELLKRELWFPHEAVPYPEHDGAPEFLKGAFFVPEYRLESLRNYSMFLLGAHESHAFCRFQQEQDYFSLLQPSR